MARIGTERERERETLGNEVHLGPSRARISGWQGSFLIVLNIKLTKNAVNIY